MTTQSLDITVSSPTVSITPAQDNRVTVSEGDTTVVVSESPSSITLSPTSTNTVEVYDPSIGLQYGINPNNPFVSAVICNALVDNVVSVAGFCAITLRWITTGTSAYVNVYRAMSTNFAHAARIGDSDEEAYTDAVEPGVTYTYWFQPVDYNGTTGVLSAPHSATSGNNAAGFVEALGAITASHLSPELQGIINQIIGNSAAAVTATNAGAISEQVIYIDTQYGELLQFVNQYRAETNSGDNQVLAQLETQSIYFTTQTTALAQQISDLTASVETDIATANAAIAQEQTTRVNEIEALALVVTTLDSTLTTDISDANALISSEAGTRANAVEAVAGEVTQLQTEFQTDLTTTRGLITQETSTRSAQNAAFAGTVTELTASITTTQNNVNSSLSDQDQALVTLSAGITSESQVRATEISALSSTVTAHTSQIGTLSTTVTTSSSSLDGILGEYNVKIDSHNRVSGFGLISDAGVSDFDISADTFSISNPDDPNDKKLFYDSNANVLKFRGQLILSNGENSTYTVTDLSDITAHDSVEVNIDSTNGTVFRNDTGTTVLRSNVSIGGRLQNNAQHSTYSYNWTVGGDVLCVDAYGNVASDGLGNIYTDTVAVSCQSRGPYHRADSNDSTASVDLRQVTLSADDISIAETIRVSVANIPN